MDHRHTGRRLAGFRHRAGQGRDVVQALGPRLTSPTQRKALALGLFVALLAGAAWSGLHWAPASEALPRHPRRVVVFSVSPLGFADLERGHTPNLDALLHRGSVAAMSVRTTSRRPSAAEGYLSLGAGSRLTVRGENPGQAFRADEDVAGTSAADLLQARAGLSATGDIVALGAIRSLDANRGSAVATGPGSLGQDLRRAGIRTAVVANGDQPATLGSSVVVDRSAAMAVMDDHLSVSTGAVQNRELLARDPHAPFGVRADRTKFLGAMDRALQQAGVVVADPGDLNRAEAFASLATSAAAARARADALERTDALLGAVLDRAGPDTLVLVVSVAPPGEGFRLTPFVATGAGVPAGYTVSPSTKRKGVVVLTDLAPTILSAMGVPVSEDFAGNPLRYQAGHVDVGLLRAYDRETAFREHTYYPWAVAFIVYQAVVYLLAAFVLTRRVDMRRSRPVVRELVLSAAAFPLATFVYRVLPSSASYGGAAWPVLFVITALIVLVAMQFRRQPLSPLCAIMAVTIAVIVYDACTGTRLHVDSWLGYSLHSAGRFYGIPNTTFAVLAACSVLFVAAWVQYSPRPREALFGSALLLAFVAIADGAPILGGDVGGIITFIPLFTLTLIALAGRRVRLRTVLILIAVTVAVVAVAAGLDLLRAPEARTHLGRFAARLFDEGPSVLTDTFLRKQGANLRILRVSIWSWMIPIVMGFLLYVLVWERQWPSLLPPRSPLRIGAIAVVAGALLGFLSNDSGPIVIALFLVYLLAYLAMLGLARRPDPPELLAPLREADGLTAAVRGRR
jgi:hypothetical protein